MTPMFGLYEVEALVASIPDQDPSLLDLTDFKRDLSESLTAWAMPRTVTSPH